MTKPRDAVEKHILDFMVAVHDCYVGTQFAGDRPVYAEDLAEATGWLAELKRGGSVDEVVTRILSPSTAKHFGDYWRQGPWGEKEADAFEVLRSRLKP